MSGDTHKSIIEDRILGREIKSNGLWAVLREVVRASIVLFPVLGEAVRIFLCQKLVQTWLVVRSKVVTTWIVRNRPPKLFCTSLKCKVEPKFVGTSARNRAL